MAVVQAVQQQQPVQQSQAQQPAPQQVRTHAREAQADEEIMRRLTEETLAELDWCMDQLEAVQSQRSVGNLAQNKFRKMLDKELSHVSDSKSGSQISRYIRSTFLSKCPPMVICSSVCLAALLGAYWSRQWRRLPSDLRLKLNPLGLRAQGRPIDRSLGLVWAACWPTD